MTKGKGGEMPRPKPGDIFTPRRSEVNSDMYVTRADLERKLRRAVNGTQHIAIFGDSGSGKTWLYKEHFRANRIPYRTVDLSVAITEGVSAALIKALPANDWVPVKKTQAVEGGAQLYVAKAGGSYAVEYEKSEVSALDAILIELEKTGAERKFIVFDNFEQISRKPEILKEISSLIIRLDNSQFSAFDTRFLFVGVVADMKELIAHFDQAGTVANRLTEVPEVTRLTENEAQGLIERGLFKKLRIKSEIDRGKLFERISFITDRNAQQLHEACYQVACESEENDWVLTDAGLDRAERDWVDTSLSHFTAHVESRMNKRETKIQRRNQVLFCLALSDSITIKPNHIDGMIREFFPDTVTAEQLGVDQIMSGLAESPNPILLKNPNDNSYRLAHPKLRLAIRTRLRDLSRKKQPTLEEFMAEIKSLLRQKPQE